MFSLIPRHLAYAQSHQCAKIERQKQHPEHHPENLQRCNHSPDLFSPRGRREELGISFWFYGAVPGVGLWTKGVSIFPTHFNMAGFALAQGAGVSQLVSGFLTKGICPYIVVESMCS